MQYHAKNDDVDVTFVVKEGPPLMVDSLDVRFGIPAPLAIPREPGTDWSTFVETRARGARAGSGEDERKGFADSTWRWFRTHGYPFATTRTIVAVDTVAMTSPTSRCRLGPTSAPGSAASRSPATRPCLPDISPGRCRSVRATGTTAKQLELGREQLTQMDIVRLALLKRRGASPAIPRSGCGSR